MRGTPTTQRARVGPGVACAEEVFVRVVLGQIAQAQARFEQCSRDVLQPRRRGVVDVRGVGHDGSGMTAGVGVGVGGSGASGASDASGTLPEMLALGRVAADLIYLRNKGRYEASMAESRGQQRGGGGQIRPLFRDAQSFCDGKRVDCASRSADMYAAVAASHTDTLGSRGKNKGAGGAGSAGSAGRVGSAGGPGGAATAADATDATTAAAEAAALSAAAAAALYERGIVLKSDDRHDAAFVSFREAHALDAKHTGVLKALADSAMLVGDVDTAVRACRSYCQVHAGGQRRSMNCGSVWNPPEKLYDEVGKGFFFFTNARTSNSEVVGRGGDSGGGGGQPLSTATWDYAGDSAPRWRRGLTSHKWCAPRGRGIGIGSGSGSNSGRSDEAIAVNAGVADGTGEGGVHGTKEAAGYALTNREDGTETESCGDDGGNGEDGENLTAAEADSVYTHLIPLPVRNHSERGIAGVGRYAPIMRGIYRTDKLLSAAQCDMLVREAEAHAAAHGGWTTGRHKSYPTTDLPVRRLGYGCRCWEV
jgi:hypothetical protein